MSNHQYDTNNDIVRYQGTISEFNNDKNDEDKCFINSCNKWCYTF